MHIAYSALQNTRRPNPSGTTITASDQLSIRFKAYQSACNKYSKEIAAIQKYIPGWVPAYPVI
ncbi:hypothetical protein [Mucilaginibacter sp. UR6-11]|uniref:hypothetical protein n=1 Tax=Mucilaginibacter sp. UR6-11 TaxID=1435644 RepID=UPI001E425E26|nr:hypothetical protein [Mucilaginibacter sp. UR6-11]MCC8427233.1 hypothetical protein [Mucilaginibacter sp. UR6-11]